jgi:hypothetical protein
VPFVRPVTVYEVPPVEVIDPDAKFEAVSQFTRYTSPPCVIAFHVKVNEPSPAVTDETTGGTDLGVTLAETVEYEPVPT